MKIWHISDTHNYHNLLKIPKNIDIVIHSGDFSNDRNVYINEPESHNFLEWYSKVDIKYKVLIAGNHDALAFKSSTKFKELCKELNIIYLENEIVTIEGINIFGSPITPSFGDWYFQKAKHKLHSFWYKSIPSFADIIVVHGPPKHILDLSENKDRRLEFCGCNGLLSRILDIKPKLVLFGHIHNNGNIINAGTKKIAGLNTIFSNGSVVTDRKFGTLTSNGNILTINKLKDENT